MVAWARGIDSSQLLRAGRWSISVALPPLFATIAYVARSHEYYVLSYLALVLSGALPTVIIYLLRRAGLEKRREAAIRLALRHLIDDQLDHGTGSDSVPRVRATVFTVRRLNPGKEKRLVPFLRLESGDERQVLQFGNDSFVNTRSFSKDDTFVGQTWKNRTAICQSMKAMRDFSGDDTERCQKWESQWKKLGIPAPLRELSLYMREVRTVWTFAVPRDAKDTSDPVAVFSVDSTVANAFGDHTQEERYGLFRQNSVRELVEATIAGIITTGIAGEKRI